MENRLYILLKYADIIAKEKETENLIPLLNDMAKDLLNVDRCSLFLYDEKKNKLFTIVAHGNLRIEIEPEKGIVGTAFRKKEPIIVADAYKDSRFDREVDAKTGYVTKNIIATPLIDSKGKVIGVFEAINKLDGEFTQEDLSLLNLISTYAASSIETSRLYNKLKKSYEETILRLSYAAEYKDQETYSHLIRIGEMSYLLAKLLGMDNEFCYNIKIASILHDIGKIGIEDKILLKRDKLYGEEWEKMKQHTFIGYKILENSENNLLQMAAKIALEHHERWDGSGYPAGKKGEEISLEARIVSIVDVFDALTSSRHYKKAWTIDETVGYMRDLAGKQFDPDILKLFLENVQDFIKIKNTYKDENTTFLHSFI